VSSPFGLGCQDPTLRFFEQHLEATKAQAFARKTYGKSFRKSRKKVFIPKCPCCKTGNLHRIAVFDQRGPPAWYLGGSQSSSSYEN
jgi:hypothetical protein